MPSSTPQPHPQQRQKSKKSNKEAATETHDRAAKSGRRRRQKSTTAHTKRQCHRNAQQRGCRRRVRTWQTRRWSSAGTMPAPASGCCTRNAPPTPSGACCRCWKTCSSVRWAVTCTSHPLGRRCAAATAGALPFFGGLSFSGLQFDSLFETYKRGRLFEPPSGPLCSRVRT